MRNGLLILSNNLKNAILFCFLILYSPQLLFAHVSPLGRQTHQQIEEIKSKIFKQILTLQTHMANSSQDNITSATALNHLNFRLQESHARLYLFDQLQLGINTHYRGTDLKYFLATYLKKLADIEHANLDPKWSSLGESYSYLSEALVKIPEKFEDPLEFMLAYLEYSPLTKPKAPETFMKMRNYTNGRDFTSATPKEISETPVSQTNNKQLSHKPILQLRVPLDSSR